MNPERGILGQHAASIEMLLKILISTAFAFSRICSVPDIEPIVQHYNNVWLSGIFFFNI